eukprot:PhF_6_TR36527/c0_g1_i5/m.53835
MTVKITCPFEGTFFSHDFFVFCLFFDSLIVFFSFLCLLFFSLSLILLANKTENLKVVCGGKGKINEICVDVATKGTKQTQQTAKTIKFLKTLSAFLQQNKARKKAREKYLIGGKKKFNKIKPFTSMKKDSA